MQLHFHFIPFYLVVRDSYLSTAAFHDYFIKASFRLVASGLLVPSPFNGVIATSLFCPWKRGGSLRASPFLCSMTLNPLPVTFEKLLPVKRFPFTPAKQLPYVKLRFLIVIIIATRETQLDNFSQQNFCRFTNYWWSFLCLHFSACVV